MDWGFQDLEPIYTSIKQRVSWFSDKEDVMGMKKGLYKADA